MKRIIIIILIFNLYMIQSNAQELNCICKINHAQIQGTNTSVFETLEKSITEFMNNRKWTEQQYAKEEKIDCILNITVAKYNPSENTFVCQLLFQSSRPVYNSSYNSTVFSIKDEEFNFTYKEYDPMEFNEVNMLDNQLTMILAYYAYLTIGMDMDTFAPLAGTDVLHNVEQIVNTAQTMDNEGWKAFGNKKNRHGIINDYMDASMEEFRRMMYKYHREGLDEMSNNVDRGRNAITESIEMLKVVYEENVMSMLPQIFTDYKRDELVGIYKEHGSEKEKNTVFEILSNINASQNTEWNKIKK